MALWAVHALAGPFGLQMLVFLAVGATAWLLHRLRRQPLGGWDAAALMAFSVATYQLQLARNALISLPLTALCFHELAAWARHRRAGRLWLLGVTLALWSFFHASAIFGWLLCALFLAGDALDRWRRSEPLWRGGACLVRSLPMLAAALVAVSWGNPMVAQLARLPAARLAHHAASRPAAQAATPAEAPAESGNFLNRLLWQTGPGGVRSVEFDSPFTRLQSAVVPASFVLIACALIAGFFTRPTQWRWLLPFLLTSFMALCYVRFVGYGAIGAVALLFGYVRLGWPSWRRVGLAMAALEFAGVAVVLASGSMPSFLGDLEYTFGLGRAPVFAEPVYDFVQRKFPERRIFTTIVTGSYALWKWDGAPRVFIDGFFAPHPASVWADYRRVREQGDPALLTARYGIDVALIENSRPDWTALYLGSPDWRPVAVASGCILFARKELVPRGESPALLVHLAEARGLAAPARRSLAIVYGGTMMSLAAHRDLPAATDFEGQDRELSVYLHEQLPH